MASTLNFLSVKMPISLSDLMDYVGSVGQEECHHKGNTQVKNLHTIGGRERKLRLNCAQILIYR